MPSMNIKDYIIAGLIAILIGMGVVIAYDKMKINNQHSIIAKAEALAISQVKTNERILKQSNREVQLKNEEHAMELDILNTTLERMRHDSASLMPTTPKASRDVTAACFDRQELTEAIAEYRREVQELTRKGAEAVLDMNLTKEWVAKELEIYE